MAFITIDARAKTIDIEARVSPMMVALDKQPFFLELTACTPDSKEHESLVVTRARPSHIHAALLALGLQPGKPAAFRTEGGRSVREPANGPRVTVEFRWKDATGAVRLARPQEWIRHHKTGEAFPAGDWVFAGSRMAVTKPGPFAPPDQRTPREYYLADGEGTLIGLTSFGSEVLAWPTPISPDSSADEPVWTANKDTVPKADTPVTIRLTVAPDAGAKP
ncbi:MAG: hypothetical protein IBJ11_01695 [Phycisphaerales bacterium]|nr:hypothetical protein [Phycisphaerales bacterium]